MSTLMLPTHTSARPVPIDMPVSHPQRQEWHGRVSVGLMVDEVERKERLAFAIEAAMAAQGMEDDDLAERIGKSPTTVGRWRRGDTVPSALEILPLATALGVEPRFLLDPPPKPTYPIEEYLVGEAVREGLQLGIRRAAGRVARQPVRGTRARPARPSPHADDR